MTRSSSTPPVIDYPLNVIVATDCGSTTTKAILIEKIGDEYRQTYRGEAPTTVEAPFEDVTRGVLNAIAEIEERSKRKILDGRSEEHTSELQSLAYLVCRLLLEKKKNY